MSNLKHLFKSLNSLISGQSVPSLSIGQQKFTVTVDGTKTNVSEFDKETKMTVCRVIIIDANLNMSKIYYEGKYNPNEEAAPPTCYSDDGIIPAANAAKKQCENCQDCPHNAFGTAINDFGGKGKACRDHIKLAVIIPSFNPELVVQFRVPPASLKNFHAYVGQFEEIGKTLDEFATYIAFDDEKNGVVHFGPDHMTDEEKLLPAKFEGKTAALIGAHNIQVHHGEVIEAKPVERPKIEKPKPRLVEKKVEPEEEPEEEEKPKKKPLGFGALGNGAKKSEPKSMPDMSGMRTRKPSGIPETKGPTGMKSMLSKAMGMNMDSDEE